MLGATATALFSSVLANRKWGGQQLQQKLISRRHPGR